MNKPANSVTTGYRTSAMLSCVALLVLSMLLPSDVHAQYRCVESGKTLYTDKPCADSASPNTAPLGNAPKQLGDATNSAYTSTNGTWRGQVQMMAKLGNAVVSEAHVVSPFVIDLDPQGKVTGAVLEAGCKLKGIAKPSLFPNMAELDVTLSGCQYAGYNRQMTGRVALYAEKRYVDFSLTMWDVSKRPGGYYEIKGTLRR